MTAPAAAPSRTEGRKKFLHYVFTTAFEGGVGYWCQAETYHWINPNKRPESTIMDDDYLDLDGFKATITDAEGEWGVETAYQMVSGEMLRVKVWDNTRLTVDIDVVERGVNLMVDKVIAAAKSGDPDAPFSREYLKQFVAQWLTDGAEGDSDAEVCDMVVQLGLFGEVVYG